MIVPFLLGEKDYTSAEKILSRSEKVYKRIGDRKGEEVEHRL